MVVEPWKGQGTNNSWYQSLCVLCLLVATVKYCHPIVLGSELPSLLALNTQHWHLHLNETSEKLLQMR